MANATGSAGDMPHWWFGGAPFPGVTPTHWPIYDLPPMRSAWECPRCKTMNAPHADRCECKPEKEKP